jgi:hypothetical protein
MINEPRAPDRARPCPAKARIAAPAAVRGTVRAALTGSALVGTAMLGAIMIGTAPSGAGPVAADGPAQSAPVARRVPCISAPLNDSHGLDSYHLDSYRLGNGVLPGRHRLGALRPYLVAGSAEPWPTPDPPLGNGLGAGTFPDAAGLPPVPASAPAATAAQQPAEPPVKPGLAGGDDAGSPHVVGREPAASSAGAEAARQSAQPDAAGADLAPTIGWTEADKRSLIYSGALALALAAVGLAMVGWRRRQW